MAHIYRYLFIAAENKQDAMGEVESDLEEWRGREFYDDFDIVEGETKLVSGIPDEFIKEKLACAEDLLRCKREESEAERGAGTREGEGRALLAAGEILCEFFCEEMPWFNTNRWSWSVPRERGGDMRPGDEWWAVMVKFYV
jgi:hypothetical protein